MGLSSAVSSVYQGEHPASWGARFIDLIPGAPGHPSWPCGTTPDPPPDPGRQLTPGSQALLPSCITLPPHNHLLDPFICEQPGENTDSVLGERRAQLTTNCAGFPRPRLSDGECDVIENPVCHKKNTVASQDNYIPQTGCPAISRPE